MKKIAWYTLMMIMITAVLPFLIVRGCDVKDNEVPPPEQQIEVKDNIKIRVYISSEKKVMEMDIEEYLKGVVAAEMPAEFELEALKAQAVASRTYAYARLKGMYKQKEDPHSNADVCTDYKHCQAWISKKDATKNWGRFSANRNWSKISRAVDETRGIILTYNNEIINPVFHSNSGGRTENAEDVWEGGSVPYLRSVVSEGEESSRSYKSSITVSNSDFYNTLLKKYPDMKLSKKDILKYVKIQGYTEGGRVKAIKIGDKILKGTEFRTIFSLKSANFKIEKKDSKNLKITTTGNGHGVGMSQCGANYLAGNGGSYDEILKYYYSGVELTSITKDE